MCISNGGCWGAPRGHTHHLQLASTLPAHLDRLDSAAPPLQPSVTSQPAVDAALYFLSGYGSVIALLVAYVSHLLCGVVGTFHMPYLHCVDERVSTRSTRYRRLLRRLFLRRCALCVCLCVVVSQQARATLIASSKISYCSNSGVDMINCTKKMVVTLTVEGGQQAGEESLVFLNSAEDETVSTGPTVKFSPISITTSRSEVRYRYPLFYVQNYNAEPYEATVKGKLLNQCNADFNPDTATCGLAYDSTGKAIPLSQGFCCDCSMCQTLGFCQPDARANKACNIFDEYTTASCLRFGQRWYSGYTIGTYITWFTLNVTVTRNTTVGGESDAGTGTGAAAPVVQQSVVLQLSPSVLGDVAGEEWGASARLVGSFTPSDQPLDLTSRMLFAPALPLADERVKAGAAEWMLLSTTLVTLDGTECNKVGVSYAAFASQGNKCNLSPGSCLGSQLEDFHASDEARVAAGKKAQYMATGYANFDLERVADAATVGKVSPYASYVAASPAATMITLTVDADDLEYIVGVATGIIVSAALNTDTLEVGTTDGVLAVVVQNTASVTGRLVVSMQTCTDGVFPVAAQILSLSALQQASLQFNVYMQKDSASGNASCTVVVRNAEEAVTDSRVVSWAVTETVVDNGTQGGTAGGGGGGSTTEESSAATCATCGTLNIVCAFQRTCWGLILLDIVVYLVIAAVIFCVIWFRHIFCCCFYKKRERSRSHSHHRRRDSSDGRNHSPTRDESSSDGGDRRRSRSRKGPVKTNAGGQRHRRRRSSSSDVARETAVRPRPPPMTYAAASPYPLYASYADSGPYGVSSSPFASPLRVQPPPLPPPALSHSFRAMDTPTGRLSSPAFYPTPPGSFAYVSASPSPPPLISCGMTGRGEWLTPVSTSPYTPPLSVGEPSGEDDRRAQENALPWQLHHNQGSNNRNDGGSIARGRRSSRRSTPLPSSATRGGRSPFT